MKNEKNHEAEQLLKDKMNELSESVDCFDRISARVFPQKDEDFSESGFTVSDLENVTDRARRVTVTRRIVLAVAAVVCITVIPQTNLINRVILNIGSGTVRKSYADIISEIDSETQNGDYSVADYPLDYYIKNDVLVTPLFACPFENCGKEDTSVRIYTRQINGISTNQVYAVEYTGDFDDNNIIAVARSGYTFSADDIAAAENYSISDFPKYYDCSTLIRQNFNVDSDAFFTDIDGDTVSIASFFDFTLMKCDSGIIPVTSEVFYGHKNISDSPYFYDITHISDTEDLQIPEREKAWKTSVYFNNNTAMSDENSSAFTQVNLFNSDSPKQHDEPIFMYPISSDINYKTGEIEIYPQNSGKKINSLILPAGDFARSTVCLYFSDIVADENSKLYMEMKTSENSFCTEISGQDYDVQYKEYIEKRIREEEQFVQEQQKTNQ